MIRSATSPLRACLFGALLPLLVSGCGWVAVGEPTGPVDPMARRSGDGRVVATAPATPRVGTERLQPAAPRPADPVEVRPLPAPSAAAPAALPADNIGPGGHVTVRPGDTVYAISRRTRVSVKGLIMANELDPPYVVQTGQRLRLPPPPQVHLVQPGETLYGVSRRYGVDTTSLARANDLSAPYTIKVGEGLLIPDATAPPAMVATAPNPPAPAAAPAPSIPPPPAAPPRSLTQRPPPSVAVADPPPATGRGFLLPVQGRIVSGFGPKPGGLHNDGINIAAPRGTPVRAAENGVVAYAGNELPGFGNLVIVKHDDGWMTAYGHNDAITVARGQRVTRGEAIARVGSTGNVGEPQLHFELRRGTRAIDPKTYFVSG